jgi:3-hydroxyacyl-CoA dehydrogenase
MGYQIREVAVLGSNGIMGSLTGGLIAQNGLKVHFIARTKDKAESGVGRAVEQARSGMIRHNIECQTYEELPQVLPRVDWIVECTAENLELKKKVYDLIDQYRRPGSIVSSMTSSLSLDDLARGRSEDFRDHFLGVHFFNPPTKLPLCELSPSSETEQELIEFMAVFLEKKMFRTVVMVRNFPAYAGNRIGFVLFSLITKLAEKTGIELMDHLLGPYTGRVLSPFRTLDLVGLDTHSAIIGSLAEHTNDWMHDVLVLPEYIKKLIVQGHLGDKTPDKGGFYRRDIHRHKSVLDIDSFSYIPVSNPVIGFINRARDLIHIGRYADAFACIRDANHPDADIVRKVLATYISYSFYCIGIVTRIEEGIHAIDRVMTSGFGWAPPGALVNLLGGVDEVVQMAVSYDVPIPESLRQYDAGQRFRSGDGKYFLAR